MTSQANLEAETLATARTMTRGQLEIWIGCEENTTIRIVVWNYLQSL